MKMNRYELMRLMRERKEREGWIRESEEVSSEVPAEACQQKWLKVTKGFISTCH